MKKYEKILKALASARRLEIIKYLKKEKEANVGDIATHLKLSFKGTSKHLGILFAAELVEREQRRFPVFYSLCPSHHSRMARAVINLL